MASYALGFTVKPVYNDHPRDREKVFKGGRYSEGQAVKNMFF
jgi:hypothetical protein